MANKTLPINQILYEYLVGIDVREPDWMVRLREGTAVRTNADMQIGLNQGKFMAFLVRLIGTTKALEIGTYTGMSACWIAGALPPDGRLICMDIDPESTAIARRFWREAELDEKIDLQLGKATGLLKELLDCHEEHGSFDYIFVDADKTGYDEYYESGLKLLRPGGLILLDNALRGGKVADQLESDPDTIAIREINLKISRDERVTSTLATIGDGLMIAMKKNDYGIR